MIKLSPCAYCLHVERIDEKLTGNCKAYPDGIPRALKWDAIDHRDPYPGDNGIRFKQDPTAPRFY
jgi:hypothetical protein